MNKSKSRLHFYFKLFDQDNDGLLSMEDFAAALRSILAEAEAVEYTGTQAGSEVVAGSARDCESKRKATKTMGDAEIHQFVQVIFQDVDNNHDGQISLAELMEWTSLNAGSLEAFGTTDEALFATFRLYDRDRSGYLDREEFQLMMQETHALTCQFSPELEEQILDFVAQ